MRKFKWVPVVDTCRCSGCGACVAVCSPASLQVIEGVVVLTDADACGSEAHCIEQCPEQAIGMAWVQTAGNPVRGRWLH